MKTRIITACVALLIFIPVVIFYDSLVFPIVLALLCAIAVYEMFGCIFNTDSRRFLISAIPAVLAGVAVAGFSPEVFELSPTVIYILFAVGILAFTLTVFLLNRKNPARTVLAVLAAIYITVAFINLSYSRTLLPSFMFLMLFVCSWASDTFAYFIGRKFGKKKLAPVLSPKKTVEGAVAGVVAGAAAMLIFFICTDKFNSSAAEYIVWPLLGAVTAAVSQAGDIYASAYKRKYGIKDYGKLFPGHGGVMDRFDSVLGAAFASPLLMIFEALF